MEGMSAVEWQYITSKETSGQSNLTKGRITASL